MNQSVVTEMDCFSPAERPSAQLASCASVRPSFAAQIDALRPSPLRFAPVKTSLMMPTNCGPMPLPMIETMISRMAIAVARDLAETTPWPILYCAPR